MNSFTKLAQLAGIGMICLLAFTGCTKKDNLTGTNWSDLHALSIRDTLGLSTPFSFPADTLVSIEGTESKLLVGNYRNAQAISYFRFTDLPDMDGITFQHEDSCYVSIKVLKRSTVSRSPIVLKLYKTNQAWNDTLSTIDETAFTAIPNAEVTIDEVSIAGTTVKIPMHLDALLHWQIPTDSLGFNLALKTPDNAYVEIASSETANDPMLYIKYKHGTETTYSTYDKVPAKDSFLLDAGSALGYTPFGIDNLYPRRMYIKFDPTTTLFKDGDGHILSEMDLKRCTINQAKLVLYVMDNSYYTGATTYSLFPIIAKKTGITEPQDLLSSDCERITEVLGSTGLVSGDSIEVDITPIVQSYISGEKEPLGIVILSQQERRNFGYLYFWDCNGNTPDDLKPFVKISYTPPFLK